MNKPYPTEEQRLAARRETWRRSKRNRYDLYKGLCDELGVSTQRNWQKHYAAIRPKVLPFEQENAHLIRRERSHYRRWWLQRHSVKWIRQVGGNLIALEDDDAWFTADAGRASQARRRAA